MEERRHYLLNVLMASFTLSLLLHPVVFVVIVACNSEKMNVSIFWSSKFKKIVAIDFSRFEKSSKPILAFRDRFLWGHFILYLQINQ